MRLNFILGTAAELIKVYSLIVEAEKRQHQVRIVMTGQSVQNFKMQCQDFGIEDAKIRQLVEAGQDLADASSAFRWICRALLVKKTRLRELLLDGPESECVIVHGDTLSTLVGAWFGWRLNVEVVHIEAGLRSNSLLRPFPEEIVRRLVTKFTTHHMAPDSSSAANLSRNRVKGYVVQTQGNTLRDTLQQTQSQSLRPQSAGDFAVVNLHRFENLNSPIRWAMLVATVRQAARHQRVVWISHPQTRSKLELDAKSKQLLEDAGVEFLDRLPFGEFLILLKGCRYLISDGGSNQEECFYLGKPCLLMRTESERSEGLENGPCLLSRFEQNTINHFLDNPEAYQRDPAAADVSPTQIVLAHLEAKIFAHS